MYVFIYIYIYKEIGGGEKERDAYIYLYVCVCRERGRERFVYRILSHSHLSVHSVCPPGKHTIHVYSSGGEPYEKWENLTPGTPEYEAYKEERADVLWKAVERCIPDVRERAEFHIIGSPLAHEVYIHI